MSTDDSQDDAALDDVEDIDAELLEADADDDGEPAAEPTTEEIIAALQREVAEQKDKNLRLRADFDNLRKRSVRDVADARAMAKIGTIEMFLPVFDHFGMALEMINTSDNVAMIQQGMNMIGTEFERGFESMGVERLKTVGQRFDPNLHEAVATEASDTVPEDHIVREFKAGYQLGARLLRASMVVVSSGPATDET